MSTHAAHHAADGSRGASLNRITLSATAHCLTGCATGEVLGLVLATWWGWGDAASIALAVALAFVFGYAFTLIPLLRSGIALGAALPVAFAADTISITVMEIVDNAVLLAVPGAMEAGLGDLRFWAVSPSPWPSPSSSPFRSTGR